MHYSVRKIGAIVALILCLAGCGNKASQYTVVGMVTYQGKRVIQGEIVFADAKNAIPAAVGKIENGKYQVSTLAGEKRIRITAAKETGKIIEGPMGVKYPERMDLIPPKYNSASTLTRIVEAKANGILDFQLE